MAATELHASSHDARPDRPGLFQALFASIAVHPAAPLVEASEEAALSQPIVPRRLRLSVVWWRSRRIDREGQRHLRRLAETSPHLLRDVGMPDQAGAQGHERHLYGLRGDNF